MGIVDGELPGAGRGGGVTGPTCNISGLGHTVKTGADQKQKQTVHVSSGNETAKSDVTWAHGRLFYPVALLQ
jgi:hypothetical protein